MHIHSTKKQNKVKSLAEDGSKKSDRTDIPAAVNESVNRSPTSGNEKASAKLPESTAQAGHHMLGRTSVSPYISSIFPLSLVFLT